MKKKLLCLLCLTLYLLSACIILSLKIEEEMATLVEVDERITDKAVARSITLPLRAVYTDPEGDHLYEVREGSGWEDGLRIREFASFSLDLVQGTASIYGTGDYRLVRSSSRQPQTGELAAIVKEFETINDRYLLYYEDGIPNVRDFPANAQLIGQSDHAFLLDMTEVSLPFFAHTMETQSVVTDMTDRIFSLTEAELFLQELPKVCVVFSILLFGILLCLASCCLKRPSRPWIACNGLLLPASLALLQYTLGKIDLPASLLPPANIFDWQYYADEFTLLFEALSHFPDSANSLLSAGRQAAQQCGTVFLAGLFLAMLAILLESRRKAAPDDFHDKV